MDIDQRALGGNVVLWKGTEGNAGYAEPNLHPQYQRDLLPISMVELKYHVWTGRTLAPSPGAVLVSASQTNP